MKCKNCSKEKGEHWIDAFEKKFKDTKLWCFRFREVKKKIGSKEYLSHFEGENDEN